MQDCGGCFNASKDFALLDNLLMLLQVFDSIVISFGSGKNIWSILRSHGDEKSDGAGKAPNQKPQPRCKTVSQNHLYKQ